MIPKVIHCCWFSGEKKPALFERCLESWRKHAPGWEIREWSVEGGSLVGENSGSGTKEDKGLNSIVPLELLTPTTTPTPTIPSFAMEALRARKWAFASDWARFAVVAAEGGVYLDLDVELVKPLDALVEAGPFFALSSDDPPWVDPGLGFAAEKDDEICAEIVRKYETMTFDPACHLSQTCPAIVNEILKNHPARRRLPAAMFNPKGSCAGRVRLTEETVAIHHYAASWFSWKQRLAYKIFPRLGMDRLLRFSGSR